MNCNRKLAAWIAPEVYIHNPKHQQGDFFHLCSGAFVANSLATERVRDIFEMAGELLPITYNRLDFFLLNVLECVNCLDSGSTEWVIGKTTGAKIRIKRYGFDRRRLTESTLFKIPETAASENMSGLDKSVNRSLGSQIQNQIKNLPEGTKIGNVQMQD